MDKLLLSCINARVSSSVLHVALAGLESDSVALFLNYLSALLKIYRGSEKVKDSLNLDAILDWLLATLDGNLGQILLSDSCQESIRILHETLSSMYALFIHVKSLRGLLNQFEFILRKPSGNLADATPSKKRCFYQIEQLHI